MIRRRVFENDFSLGKNEIICFHWEIPYRKATIESYQTCIFRNKEYSINLNEIRSQINHLKSGQSIFCNNLKRIGIIIPVPFWWQWIIQVLVHKNRIQICSQKTFNCDIKAIIFYMGHYWRFSSWKSQNMHEIINRNSVALQQCWRASKGRSTKTNINRGAVFWKFWWLPFRCNSQSFQSHFGFPFNHSQSFESLFGQLMRGFVNDDSKQKTQKYPCW